MAVIWFGGTISLLWLPVVYTPNGFSVPFKPFTPALAVLAILHLMFSLQREAYILFGSFQALGVIVYIFYGMHHSQEGEPPIEVDMANIGSSEIGRRDRRSKWKGAKFSRLAKNDDVRLIAGFPELSDEGLPGAWDSYVPQSGPRL